VISRDGFPLLIFDRRVVAVVYRAAVVMLKSEMSGEAGSLPNSLGFTLAALKRIVSGGSERAVSTEASVSMRNRVSVTSPAWVEMLTLVCGGDLGGYHVEVRLRTGYECDVCDTLRCENEGVLQGDSCTGADVEGFGGHGRR
jgi:hypothetical protein